MLTSLTSVSSRFARVFDRFGATQVVAPDIFKALEKIWYIVLLQNTWSLGQFFGFTLSFFRLLKASLFLRLLKASFLVLCFSYIHKWSSWWCFLQYWYIYQCYVSILIVWLCFWFVTTVRVGFWAKRLCVLGQRVTCWFQCWKNSLFFFWTFE